MNAASPRCENTARARFSVLEVLLLIGLPAAVFIAGALSTSALFNGHVIPAEPPAVQQAR